METQNLASLLYYMMIHATKKQQPLAAVFYVEMLLLHDLQDLHGAGLDTDAAGDALGSRTVFGCYHDLHGAGFYTLATGGAKLLVDHVDTGLGVLGDCTSLADLSTLAALNADHGLCLALLLHDLDTGQILMELLIESGGTGVNALQTCHALSAFFYSKLLHNKESPLLIFRLYYTRFFQK